MNRYFGIDFGTTSSAVVSSTIEGISIQNRDYGVSGVNVPLPSIVAINKETGDVITGLDVKNKRDELSKTYEIIYSIKTALDKENYRLIAGKKWYPEDIAAELFRALRKTVNERTGENMTEAEVAIPVGFSAKKRRVLRKAAKMAGVRITSFVSESTAAFFSNYKSLKSASMIAVFDWGGGTLDVSVLKNIAGSIEEVSKAGQDSAGDYIDEKIARYVHHKISVKKGFEIRFEDVPLSARDALRVKCEEAKIQLADMDSRNIFVSEYGNYGMINYDLDCKTLDEIIAPEIDMAMECLSDALEQAGIGKANIDKILLVGGSSKLRSLRKRMEKEFQEKVLIPDEPEWDIAKGASLVALHGGENYSNQSVGIIISDGSYFEFLQKDTKIDGWRKDYKFGITDSSDYAQFVFDGSPDIRTLPSRFRTLDVPCYGFLQEKIEVSASVDEDLVFKVEAKSDRKDRRNMMVWEYENLKCCYRLR